MRLGSGVGRFERRKQLPPESESLDRRRRITAVDVSDTTNVRLIAHEHHILWFNGH